MIKTANGRKWIEKDVKKGVKRLLDQHNWFWWMPPANGFGRGGISDFHALRTGVFMAIETKVGRNKPSAMQEGFLTSISNEGAFAFCVSEAQLDDLAAWLAAFDRSVLATQKGTKPSDNDGSIMINSQIAMSWRGNDTQQMDA